MPAWRPWDGRNLSLNTSDFVDLLDEDLELESARPFITSNGIQHMRREKRAVASLTSAPLIRLGPGIASRQGRWGA